MGDPELNEGQDPGSDPAEGAEATGEGQDGQSGSEATPKQYEIAGRKFTEEQLGELIRNSENNANWKAENTRKSQELAEVQRQLQAREEQLLEAIREGGHRRAPDQEPDPDEPITRGELMAKLDEVQGQLQQIEEQRVQQFKQEQERRYISTIDATVEDSLNSSKVLSNPKVRANARKIILASLWENPGPEGDNVQAVAKHVRDVVAGVEKEFMELRELHIRDYVGGKEKLKTDVPQVPKGGAPAQQKRKFATSMAEFDKRSREIVQRYDGQKGG